MFQISIVNRTRTVADLDLHRVVRAINRQVAEDFEPYWDFGGRLRVEGPASGKIDTNALREMRGDAVVYLLDSSTSDDALGYHDRSLAGIPFGFVYLDLCAQLGDPWSATLSHEALELIGDPQCNLLVQGPNPRDSSRPDVYHYFEMCDAVQAQVYEIDGVPVSNFVLPAYFTPNESEGTRKDFAGTGLRSFGVNSGGYIGFFDPHKTSGGSAETFFADDRSRQRYAIKKADSLPLDARPMGRVARRQGLTAFRDEQSKFATRGPVAASAALRQSVAIQGATAAASAVDSDPIRHVVVLMLENRSFDHMLGGLQGSVLGLDGVDPANPGSNVDKKTGKSYEQRPTAMPVVSRTFSTPHEHADVLIQISEGMGNFVNNFVANQPNSTASDRAQVMAYFKDGSLGVLHALAKNYLVCNRWFSSLPGPTWPNRLFAHSGTSLGQVLMPNADNPGEIAQLWGTYKQDTLYDRLDAANFNGRPVSWKIYHDGFPQSVLLDHLKKPFFTGRYASMKKFIEDATFEPTFPQFCFIEPRYSNSLTSRENDQHPPAGVAEGEQLIASVYNAIRGNDALWRSTLLIITYDEHGGFYDHVTPPSAIPPDGNQAEYAFNQLGVRVPTILVSPYVQARCDDTVYDHTSILRYVLEKYGLPPLGDRTKPSSDPRMVGNFADQLLSTPRSDSATLPVFSSADKKFAAAFKSAAKASAATNAKVPPDNSRRLLLAFAERMRTQSEGSAVLGTAGAGRLASAKRPAQPSARTPEGFAERVEDVDTWLQSKAVMSSGDAGRVVASSTVMRVAQRDGTLPAKSRVLPKRPTKKSAAGKGDQAASPSKATKKRKQR